MWILAARFNWERKWTCFLIRGYGVDALPRRFAGGATPPREDLQHLRREFVMSALIPCAMRLIVRSSWMWHSQVSGAWMTETRRIQSRQREPCEACKPDRIPSLRQTHCCVGAPCSWL